MGIIYKKNIVFKATFVINWYLFGLNLLKVYITYLSFHVSLVTYHWISFYRDNMTFDQCVEEKKLPDCVFNEGSGYLLQKAHYIY